MTSEDLTKYLAALEALLFVHGEPLAHKKIEAVLGLQKGDAETLLHELAKRLEDPARGIALIMDREKAQLATKPAWSRIVEDFVKEEIAEDLTPASLEALAIIAYLGPLSRAKLEYLRGVNSIVILRSLMIRGLIERSPDPEHPAGFLYRPTFDLMKHLGIAKEEELPEFAKFRELLKIFDEQNPTAPAAAQEEKTPQETAPGHE